MLVAIPSKGRPDKIKSHRVLPLAHVYVPENEVAVYEKVGIENVVGIPNEVRGITRTRNWILDNTDEKYVVFVDDDVKRSGFIEMKETKTKYHKLNGEQFMEEFWKLFCIMDEMGFRIWGTSTEGSPRAVYPYRPFLFYPYVTASCMGMVNDPELRFDENYPVKEDYELCLRCIVEDGGILAARYLFWENEHWETDGGCKEYRTQEMERKAIQRLQKQYPGMVSIAKNRKGQFCISLNFGK